MKKIDDIEIAKMMLDVRKRSILDIAKTAITVTQMAEELNEKPSRLYYHVKKLEEAGLLELVETRQQGNLIEKYYKRTKDTGKFQLGENLLKEHHDTLMAEFMKLLEPGLKLLQTELRKGNSGSRKQVDLMVSLPEQTGREWVASQERILNAIQENWNGSGSGKPEESNPPNLTEEQLNKKSKYAYILLSYRVDDAELEE